MKLSRRAFLHETALLSASIGFCAAQPAWTGILTDRDVGEAMRAMHSAARDVYHGFLGGFVRPFVASLRTIEEVDASVDAWALRADRGIAIAVRKSRAEPVSCSTLAARRRPPSCRALAARVGLVLHESIESQLDAAPLLATSRLRLVDGVGQEVWRLAIALPGDAKNEPQVEGFFGVRRVSTRGCGIWEHNWSGSHRA